jgi:hypothetical protein
VIQQHACFYKPWAGWLTMSCNKDAAGQMWVNETAWGAMQWWCHDDWPTDQFFSFVPGRCNPPLHSGLYTRFLCQ